MIVEAGHYALVLALVLGEACTSANLASSGRSERPASSDPFHDLLVTADACAAPPPATIMRGQALGDLDRVERIVRRGYSGFDVLNLGGLDWNETFRRARAVLNATREPIPVDSATRAARPCGTPSRCRRARQHQPAGEPICRGAASSTTNL